MDLLSAFFNGVLLGITPLLLNQLSVKGEILTAAIIIIFSFLIALIINLIIQVSTCGTIKPNSLAKNSLYQPAFSTIFLAISYIPFLSWAVEGILPQDSSPDLKRSLSKGFYLFWGAVYSQLLGSGFIQSCN